MSLSQLQTHYEWTALRASVRRNADAGTSTHHSSNARQRRSVEAGRSAHPERRPAHGHLRSSLPTFVPAVRTPTTHRRTLLGDLVSAWAIEPRKCVAGAVGEMPRQTVWHRGE